MRSPLVASSLLPLHALWFAALASALAMLLLTGCGMGPRLIPPSSGSSLHGLVHGGQQPVAGSRVYLFAANTTGFGNPSVSLLNAAATGYSDTLGAYVISAADGTFDITNDYTCAPGAQVYLYASGGDPGSGPNSAIGLMAILGACPDAGNLSSIPFVEINEVSTVAAAFSIAAFSLDGTDIADDEGVLSNATAANAAMGMFNAFANAANLVDLGTGVALATTPAGNGTVPQATLNTLANILAACVNTSDPTQPSVTPGTSPSHLAHPRDTTHSATCSTLFDNTPAGSVYPTDTATAAINIAHNPSANINALFTLPIPQSPFYPILTSQPANFSLQLAFAGHGIVNANNLAIDASGNIWLSDTAALDELGPNGSVLSPSIGYTDASLDQPGPLAIDSNGNIWVLNLAGTTGSSLSGFSSSGTFLVNSATSGYARSLAIDPSTHIWVPNNSGAGANGLDEFSSTGSLLNTFTGGGLNAPSFISVDATGSLWLPNNGSTAISKFSSAGLPDPSGPFATGITSAPVQTAIGSTGDVYILGDPLSLGALDSSGVPISTALGGGSPYIHGVALTLDGNGVAYLLADVAVPGPTTAYLFASLTSSGENGFYLPSGASAQALAIDPSGNLWLPEGSSVVEYIGLAAPVVTPLATAVAANKIATLP